ncbi:MAG: TonB-dependent receptor plug domain-containing protein [Prevotellaceae bacterium]|jgi:TonB-dependent SusC/RagA subfamily outer membrane receptor|nr:TonB-dependent receptor plug domain-containing protein [Prevotellaceae bacterium]
MKLLFTMQCLILPFLVFGQETDVIENSILKQLQVFPQEKIHLHTDKSTYVSGEKVWYRAYLVDALLHQHNSPSRYIYVELLSPAEELITRDKIRPSTDSVFHNSIDLPENLPEGSYLIRAYTNFMRNREDYFFEKRIFVADPISSTIHVEPEFVINNKKGKLKLDIRNYDNETVEVKNFNIRIDTGKMKKYNEEFSFGITSNKRHIIYLEFEANSRQYKKYIPVPEQDFDVSFFPEGGYMVDNVPCKIGFKALKSTGVSEAVTGEVFDNENNSIGTFNSGHAGMGSFHLTPQEGKKYWAECISSTGVKKRYELPQVRPDACALKVLQNKNKLYINIQKGSKYVDRPMHLLVHIRGVAIHSSKVVQPSIAIEKALLPSGVIQILLLDETNNVLSERLFFNLNKNEMPVSTLTTDKPEYKRREKVVANINITDTGNIPLEGSFSVSVTDNNDVAPDSSFTILSQLLLSSEIKGYIESPAHYLENVHDADFLMLTQGWRRYNIPAVLKDTLEKPKHYMEAGQEISGTVKRVVGSKKNEMNSITIFSPAGHLDMALSDENGRFAFNGFEYPDSTLYVIQALNKRGGKYVELLIDPETFPPIYPFVVPDFTPDSLFRKYIEKSDLKYTDEFGSRVTVMEEIVVTASKKPVVEGRSSMYSSMSNTVINIEEIEKSTDLRQILIRASGITLSGDNIHIRGSSNPAIVIVDDIVWEDFRIDDMPVMDIERIEIMKGAEAAILGSRGAGGAIIIMTKTGKTTQGNVIRFNIKSIFPKGYKKDVEFYAPKYDNPDAPTKAFDRRTTIYWNPFVKFVDGKAQFEFYTADVTSTYSIIVEGITTDGRIIRQSGEVKIKH